MNSTPILHTKIIVPQRKKELISRSRLLEFLNEVIDAKLVLVTAPAGYGKTSLLIDFAHQKELPVCWFAIDSQDQDLIRFVRYFIASLKQTFPGFGEQSLAALQTITQGLLTTEQLAALIAEEIYQVIQEHFVLVLDDYHLVIESQPVNYFINQFLRNVGENCHLVILSRSLLPLEDLPVMVARLQAKGLGFRELAFRSAEIQALFLQNYQQFISPETADAIAQKTEGWITGLLLTAQTMLPGFSESGYLSEATGVDLYDYLASQILNQIPSDLRSFLLRTSLFTAFNDQICARILGQPPSGRTWQEMINWVLNFNLFVIPYEQNGTWLRYHHLFQEFLQAQLFKEEPAEYDRILRESARDYENQENYLEAHAIYQKLGDITADTQLLVQVGPDFIKRGRLNALADWLNALPANAIQSHPFLFAQKGMVSATLGNPGSGLELLDQAVGLLEKRANPADLSKTLVWRAMVQRMQGSSEAALVDLSKAFLMIQEQPQLKEIEAEAFRINGQILRKSGKISQAIQDYTKALAIFESLSDDQGVARLSLELGQAFLDQGDYETALTYYQQALSHFEAEHNFYALASTLNDLGVLHFLQGNFQKAYDLLEKSLTYSRKSDHLRAEALAHLSLGDLFYVLDLLQAAEEAYHHARQVVIQINDSSLLAYLELAESSLALKRCSLALARKFLEFAEIHTHKTDHYTYGLVLLRAACLELAEKKYSEAISHFEKAQEIFSSGGQNVEVGQACLLLARIHFETGDLSAAGDLFHQALRSVAHLKNNTPLLITARETKALLESLARLPGTSGEAVSLLESVERLEQNILAFRKQLRKRSKRASKEAPPLKIFGLGSTSVYLRGKRISSADWQTQITRDLFFLLLMERKGWTKEAIGEYLWPESSPSQLKLRFKNTLYRLRHALGQEVVLFDGELYWFNWDFDYDYNVENFQEFIESAETLTDSSRKKHALSQAVELYRGEFVPEITQTWVIAKREQLHQMFIHASMQYGKLLMNEGDFEATLKLCQRIFANDPYLEEAHRLAMLSFAASGNRPAIFKQFQQLEEGLLTEFQVHPSPETVALYQKLIQ